jgi:hypothetical protein
MRVLVSCSAMRFAVTFFVDRFKNPYAEYLQDVNACEVQAPICQTNHRSNGTVPEGGSKR